MNHFNKNPLISSHIMPLYLGIGKFCENAYEDDFQF